MNTQRFKSAMGWITMALLAVLVTMPVLALGGCSVWEDRPRLRKQKVDMNVPVVGIPPIMLDTLNEHYLLIMRAPSSGWSIEIDKDERIATGMRVFVTVRRPDPTFLYPQAIVNKRLLTEIRTDSSLEIYARLLDAHEETKGRGYGKLAPVEQFEE